MTFSYSEPLQAVIFDLGGVLFENIQEFYLPDLAQRYGMDPDHLLTLAYRHGQGWGFGRSTEEDYWRGILIDAGLSASLLPELVEGTSAYIRPIHDTWELVRALPPDLRLGILSNTTHEWVRRQQAAMDWSERFEPVLLSCEVGLCKPDAALYALLLERLALPGERVLFVDDREENLVGAAALGIQGHLFQDAAKLRAELAMRGLLPL